MPRGYAEMKIFSGSAHPGLVLEIAEFLGVPVGQGPTCSSCSRRVRRSISISSRC